MNTKTKSSIIRSYKIQNIYLYLEQNLEIQNPVLTGPQNWKNQLEEILSNRETGNCWNFSNVINLQENKPVPVAQVDPMTTCRVCLTFLAYPSPFQPLLTIAQPSPKSVL